MNETRTLDLPLRLEGQAYGSSGAKIRDASNRIIASGNGISDTALERGWADQIVRACNNHDALLAACKAALPAHYHACVRVGREWCNQDQAESLADENSVVRQLRAAIASAEA